MAYDFNTATVTTRSKQDVVREMMAALTNLDVLARQMERKWGVGRLPALAPDDLCQRFYRQLEKLNGATKAHDDEQAIVEAKRMASAWRTLDAEVERLGGEPISPCVQEVQLADGSIAAIVRDVDEAYAIDTAGRNVKVFMLSEISRLIEAMPTVCAVKEHFPGATVTSSHAPVPDGFWERGDEIPF